MKIIVACAINSFGSEQKVDSVTLRDLVPLYSLKT